ncbi:DUF4179 domain-containing protein [Paenibacillus sp. MWE-103]|uniref:DUF4179 domain-containing protein n=1 Tax=Paenibacillus artemisiicola TaxID=1172618 RepID=A0ABS3WKE3_9BACL|nr:DUF4179 domain-containing protein [Paenibacillus artemisiicola]MBO7748803.1 DUF4179 domain-containing protein [Paenibacillus artemisiicola]
MILPEHERSRLEAGLADEQAAWDAAPVPAALDEAVLRGVARARRTGRSRARRTAAGASVALVLALLLGLVRVSPAFAAAVAELPGLSGLVALVAGDKGLEGAVRNDFVQPVSAGDSHDGVTFTVTGIIADDTRLNVFYTVKLPEKTALPYDRPRVYDADTGKPLLASYSSGGSGADGELRAEFHQRMDISLAAGTEMPDRIKLSIGLTGYPQDKAWTAIFPIDKTRFEGLSETIPLDQTVTVQGQRIRFARAVVHPTSIEVDAEFDDANAMKIFWLGDLRIVTDAGEELRSYGSTSASPSKVTLQFESAFFSKPKHLTLEGSRIMALDKSKLELTLDLAKKRIVQAPDDRVRIISAEKTGPDKVTVRLGVKTNKERDRFSFSIVDGGFHDAAGREFQIGGYRTSSTNETDEMTTTFEAMLDKPYTNPLTFRITDYPSWIEQPFTVKLK